MASENILEITEENHSSFLENEFAVLNFFSDWKMDCLMCLPVIESLAEEFGEKIRFGIADIDDCEKLVEKHNITKVPSILFFKFGKLIDKLEKFSSEEILREKIACLI